MSIFGVEEKDFNDFKREIREKILAIENQLNSKITDSEESARSSAAQALNFAEAAKFNADKISTLTQEISSLKDNALKELETIKSNNLLDNENRNKLIQQLDLVKSIYENFVSINERADSKLAELTNKSESVATLIQQTAQLPENLALSQKAVNEAKSLGESINNTFNHIISRKSEIDDLHKKILGENITNSEGSNEHVDGLKDELDRSYRNLSDTANTLHEKINFDLEAIKSNYDIRLKKQNGEFEKFIDVATHQYEGVNDKLNSLLPGAMAAGLSAAYEKKKTDEESSLKNFEGTFKSLIIAMVSVSLIPVAIDLYMILGQGKELLNVIHETPYIAIGILPIYLPILWFAISTGKKLSLSKRLIEEYTHKAVLGKTFSGLSNQIETLSNQNEIKEQLRTKLLFNILQVSAENPGKLITDYNKSDHPLMEVIERSSKLSDSMEALAKIPGLSSIAKKINAVGEEMLEKQAEKVEKGIFVQEALEAKK